ncbi:MAG TPA: S-layer homology domain-containing protein, partial [Chloroflexia bacterium]
VCPEDWFYIYVMDLTAIQAVSGHADGTFRPDYEISRGQVMKVVVQAMDLSAAMPSSPTFADVPAGHTFYQWIETGAAMGLASGYPCGGPGEACDSQDRPYFRSNYSVSRGQLAKMLVVAKSWTPLTPGTATFQDVPAGSAFYGYVERVAANGVINGYPCGGPGESCPGTYFRPSGTATRAQASKMVSLARRDGRPIPTPTPQPAGSGACPIFPADNIWNRRVDTLPLHPMSNAYIASIGLESNVHADFGSGLWDGGPIGIPFVKVPAGQPMVNINFTNYGDESDPGPYPVPTSAPVEGGPDDDGDRHVLVLQDGTCKLYELYRAFPNPDGSWDADSAAVYDLRSNALRTEGWTSADAAGLPIYPGLVTYDEVASGAIRHAIRFTASETQRKYIWPARHFASDSDDPDLPPMGLRVRLKSSVDLGHYPQQVRVILQAMKDYGLILADNGSPWYISGAPDPRWDNDMLHAMDDLQGSDFEAVYTDDLMVDPNSGQSR